MPKIRTGNLRKSAADTSGMHPPDRDETPRAWHARQAEEALAYFNVDPRTGLDEAHVERLRERYGSNSLPEHKPPTAFAIFLHQFKSPLIYILLIAALVSIAIGDLKDASFIFAVLLLNAVLGTIQEWKAERGAAALQSLMKTQAHVIRNGERLDIPQEQLVPGDVVLLESGNKVPADIRLLEINNLSIDEALLTGESVPVEKSTEPSEQEDLPVGDRHNMAYAGSLIVRGRGKGVVVATGLKTEMGLIAESVTEGAVTKTPLIIRMEKFTRRIALVILGSVVIVGVAALLKGMPTIDAVFLVIALAVSAIPEGLPVVLTVALSLATQRMAKRNVIVRKLPAVEGLGSCTYIVSDKTGTLTVNRQTLRQVLLPDGQRFRVSGEGESGEGDVETDSGGRPDEAQRAALERLARIGIICNEGELRYQSAKGAWTQNGDAVDVAILGFGYKLGLDPENIRQSLDITGAIPYESERGYAAMFYREDGRARAAVKGASERLLPSCHRMMTPEGPQPIDRTEVERLMEGSAEEGYRVLLIAEGDAPDPEAALPPLTLLGFIGMIDPLRSEAAEAVRKCRQAGIQVAMVTGDHPATALAIARELDIARGWDDLITGQELGELCAVEDRRPCMDRIRDVRVFARVSPLQKVNIVETLREQGHFVAVTGDGVNDAPALRKANIGVAMGSGSDVTKDIAAIIVVNDNFATIQAGVEEGRFAYANIRKVVWFLISNGTAEIVLFMMTLFFGLPLPLLPVQLLWANLVTSGIQDIALAFEKGEPEVMKQPPTKPTDHLFNRPMIAQTLVSGVSMGLVCFGVFYWLNLAGYDEDDTRNVTLLTLVMLENYNAFNCRSQYHSLFRVPLSNNYALVAGVLGAHGIHLLAMHFQPLRGMLRLSPVSFELWLQLFVLASVVMVAVEVFKRFRTRPLAKPHAVEA